MTRGDRGDRLWSACARVQFAHLIMLRECGLIDDTALASCLTGVGNAAEGAPSSALASIGIVLDFDERAAALTRAEAAGALRVGRGVLDIVATMHRMDLRDGLITLANTLSEFRTAALDAGSAHIVTLLPIYVDGQVAQPLTLGHAFGAIASKLERAAKRLHAAIESTNRSPCGAGSLASTGMPIDREFVAGLLGFDGLIVNSLDAVTSNDHFSDTAHAVSDIVASLLGAIDFVLEWSHLEPASVRFNDEWLVSLSDLPQMRVPAGVVRLRERLERIPHEAHSVATFCGRSRLQPGATANDWVAERTTKAVEELSAVMSRSGELLSGGIEFNRALFANRAGKGFSTGSDLADFLMLEEGIDPESARSISALAISRARDQGLEASGITPEIIDGAALLVIGREIKPELEAISRYLAPRRFIERRTAPGSPSPNSARAHLDGERQRLVADRTLFATIENRIREAQSNLEREIARAISSSS